MKYYIILILSFTFSVFRGQSNEGKIKVDVNQLFKVQIDSIEIEITENNWGIDTNYYLHYEVTNISKKTLTYNTNTCFYYNHSSLIIDSTKYELNDDGGCSSNSFLYHTIKPDSSFKESEEIEAIGLQKLRVGKFDAQLKIHLILSPDGTYYVDGRDFIENKEYLYFIGQIQIIYNYIDKRKKRKIKKAPNTIYSKYGNQ